jgi:hypothetical protein
MELWQKADGQWRPGYRIDSPSMQVVRRFLEKSPDWNLARFIALGHKEFHDKESRTLNYFLGGALSHFFLHYGDEVYREDFIRLLKDYYEGKLREDSLPEYIRMTGVDSAGAKLEKLQEQFREYMKDLKRPGSEPPEGTKEPAAGTISAGGGY